MRDARASSTGRWYRVLFVAFAACTLWLVVENSILCVMLTQVRVETRHE